MRKILVAAPKYTAAPGDFYQFPLGLGYIISALKRAGHDVKTVNCNHSADDPAQLIARAVEEFNPDIFATGGLSPFMPGIKDLYSAARRIKPGIVNVAGGGVLSSDPEAGPIVMDIDVGVIGEGEETVVDLADALDNERDLKSVLGIVYRDGPAQQIRRTSSRPAIADLGTIAWPDYDALQFGDIIDLQRPNDNYFFHTQDRPRAIDMITSRSCPYRCTFCFHPTGKVYRERPLDDFFAELDHLVARHKINMVAVIDELFSLKKARLLEFCERIEPYGLQWMVQLHTNCADDYILDAMKKAGCSYISYGIESMSQPILESMKKKSKKPRIEKVLVDTFDRRIGIQGNLIFGDTSETLETANESFDWWASNRRYMINTNRLQVYPGSPDYIEAVRDGLITDRVGYIDSQFVDLNISRLNDEDLSILATKIWTAQSSLLSIPEVTHFEREPEPDPVRGTLYRISWNCPRCEHHNDYRGVVLENVPSTPSYRLTCRECMSRFDVPNGQRLLFENQPLKPELDGLFAQAKALIDAGRGGETPDILHNIVGKGPWYWPAQVELGRFYWSVNARPSALRHYSAACQTNPFEPACHQAYASALIEERAIGLALRHLQQAHLLDPGNLDILMELRELEAGNWTEQELATYVVSYSDAPAPQRLPRAQAECGKKQREDHEFPDVAKLETDARELIAQAAE